jgi:hypothetical protein
VTCLSASINGLDIIGLNETAEVSSRQRLLNISLFNICESMSDVILKIMIRKWVFIKQY